MILATIVKLFCITVALTVHEYAHAKTADSLGDPTPSLRGRLSLNPLRHLDPIGAILIVLGGFGWAKPVEVDIYNFQDPKRDFTKVALAGPLSNVFMAIVAAIVLKVLGLLEVSQMPVVALLAFVIKYFIVINVSLALFNLIPVYPLDGYNIVQGLLQGENSEKWASLRQYGFFILVLLIIPLGGSGSMLDVYLQPVIRFLIGLLGV